MKTIIKINVFKEDVNKYTLDYRGILETDYPFIEKGVYIQIGKSKNLHFESSHNLSNSQQELNYSYTRGFNKEVFKEELRESGFNIIEFGVEAGI